MKKTLCIILMIIVGLLAFSNELNSSEKKSRQLFSESLELLFKEKKFDARLKLNEAMNGEVYLNDIPKFWYYAAKLDLQLGLIEKAKEDINNILLFTNQDEEVETLLNFIRTMENFSLTNYSTPSYYEIVKISGNKDAFERFYTIDDLEIINSTAYLLDSKNNLIFKSNNFEEKWIKLPKDKKFNTIASDKNLNRIYLGSEKGIYYFEPSTKFSYKEISEDSTPLLTPNTSEENFKILKENIQAYILGVDRAGRIISYNPYLNQINYTGYDGSDLNILNFKNDEIFIDGKIYNNKIFLLERKNRQIYIYDELKNAIIQKIKLPDKDYLSIEILPWGKILVSTLEDSIEIEKDGEFYKLNDEEFIGKLKIKNGIFIKNNLQNYEVSLNRLYNQNDLNMYNLNVYGLNFNKEDLTVTAKFNANTLSGEIIEYPTKDISVEDSGGRVAFDYYRIYSKTNTYEFENMDDFFQTGISQIKTDSKIILKNEINQNFEIKSLIPILITGSSIYYVNSEQEIPQSFIDMIYYSGGIIMPEKYHDYLKDYLNNSYKPMDYLKYSVYPPLIEGIKQTKVSLNLSDKILSDTLYYYTEGVGSE
ncbi:hypothetical protein OF820_07300 [Oceanotoga sp. DSM 15011]|uniref:hypothetical protein n=1 Tax=Oceanotoga sp. DSM 15011 TaxID=2984951 RepID=UPI0021F4BEA7|nr:hypothetical protein [Oceanotoga sp. DSM 15011]UYO98880.1 hypothetical protein OF820_07300 [Oceanotoga sp. DSM 15011]